MKERNKEEEGRQEKEGKFSAAFVRNYCGPIEVYIYQLRAEKKGSGRRAYFAFVCRLI